jgi:hypothetical protein
VRNPPHEPPLFLLEQKVNAIWNDCWKVYFAFTVVFRLDLRPSGVRLIVTSVIAALTQGRMLLLERKVLQDDIVKGSSAVLTESKLCCF